MICVSTLTHYLHYQTDWTEPHINVSVSFAEIGLMCYCANKFRSSEVSDVTISFLVSVLHESALIAQPSYFSISISRDITFIRKKSNQIQHQWRTFDQIYDEEEDDDDVTLVDFFRDVPSFLRIATVERFARLCEIFLSCSWTQ